MSKNTLYFIGIALVVLSVLTVMHYELLSVFCLFAGLALIVASCVEWRCE